MGLAPADNEIVDAEPIGIAGLPVFSRIHGVGEQKPATSIFVLIVEVPYLAGFFQSYVFCAPF